MQDERILNEKRRHRESSFDAHPAPGARLDDLDLRYFEEEYLPRAIDAATLEQNDRSTAATKARGLPIARRELRANGQPDPRFNVTPQRVFCTVQARAAARG